MNNIELKDFLNINQKKFSHSYTKHDKQILMTS